jgi:transcriptional regulator with XRE-family HTH domain
MLPGMSERLKREIKAALKREGLTYAQIGNEIGLTEGAVRNTLSGERELLTRNALKLLDALNLEATVTDRLTPEPGGDDA